MNDSGESCTWCGTAVEADDGFRAYEPAGERRAVFCRLEHVIPWAIQDAHWEADTRWRSEGKADGATSVMGEPPSLDRGVEHCSHCDAELDETRVLLVRHRGEHRVADGFCSVDHMQAWARAGGRWQ